jgi:hypothetical protein
MMKGKNLTMPAKTISSSRFGQRRFNRVGQREEASYFWNAFRTMV